MSNKDLPKWLQHHTGMITDPTPEEIEADRREHFRDGESFDQWYNRTGHKQHADLIEHYGAMGGKPAPSNALQWLARVDWKRVFIWAVIAVNVLSVIYGLSKIGAAFAIGGAVYAVVTAGTTVFYMLFFAAFAVVMVKRYDGMAMFATGLTLLCAFVI